MAWRVEMSGEVDEAQIAELREVLLEYNFATTGYRDGKTISCFLRDEDETLVAGIDGFSWGGYAHIDLLWVTDALRGQGVGAALITEFEAEARRRGVQSISVTTHEFQAPGFYPRFGFVEAGATIDTPVGHRHFMFQKML